MEGLAHAVQTGGGEYDDRLWSLEGFARCELPVKAERVDAHGHAGGVPGIDLCLCEEVSGIDQAEADCLAGELGGFRALEDNKRIVVVRRSAAGAFHALDALLQAACFEMTFSRPRAGELEPFVIHIRQIQTQAHCGGQMQIHAAVVCKARASCQRGTVCKQRIAQLQIRAEQLITQSDGQGLCLVILLGIGCRQPVECGLSGRD